MKNNDFEKEYEKEIDQLKDFYENIDSDKSPNLDQIRTFVRSSKEDIQETKAKKFNLFRAVALAGISCFLVGLKVYPIGAVSLSILSIFVMPLALSLSKGYGK